MVELIRTVKSMRVAKPEPEQRAEHDDYADEDALG
jgi:hypothetical protein